MIALILYSDTKIRDRSILMERSRGVDQINKAAAASWPELHSIMMTEKPRMFLYVRPQSRPGLIHATPSAVSEHLRQLEEEFQVLLFDRSKQGMALTAAGERLLMPVRQVFTAVEDVRNTAISLRAVPKATLRLGLNSPPEYLRVDQVLRQKTTALPHLNLEMKTRSSAQIIEQVLSDELDLGYVYGNWNDPRLRIVPLKPVRV